MRLLVRVLDAYPRSFDIGVADALCTSPQVCTLVRSGGKDLSSVLKANQTDLLGHKMPRGIVSVLPTSEFVPYYRQLHLHVLSAIAGSNRARPGFGRCGPGLVPVDNRCATALQLDFAAAALNH